MSLYVDTDALKKTLNLTGTTYADDDIEQAAFAASDAIDQLCGTVFAMSDDSNDEVRRYTADGPGLVTIDDLASFTSLAIDRAATGSFTEEWTIDRDFVLAPDNAAALGHPYQWIKARQIRWFPMGEQCIQVTGRFGWLETPTQIVEAAQLLTQQLLDRKREAVFGVVALDTTGAVYVAKNDPHLAMLLEPFCRAELA